MFSIYVDADSFPSVLMNIVLKRIVKESCFIEEAVFVSDRVIPKVREVRENHTHLLREEKKQLLSTEELKLIKSNIRYIVVESSPDAADDEIVAISKPPAIAITHDVPLSYRLVEKGLVCIDDRGHIYTKDNVGERLSERNFNTDMREYGMESGRTKSLTQADINAFSSSFDALIYKLKNKKE